MQRLLVLHCFSVSSLRGSEGALSTLVEFKPTAAVQLHLYPRFHQVSPALLTTLISLPITDHMVKADIWCLNSNSFCTKQSLHCEDWAIGHPGEFWVISHVPDSGTHSHTYSWNQDVTFGKDLGLGEAGREALAAAGWGYDNLTAGSHRSSCLETDKAESGARTNSSSPRAHLQEDRSPFNRSQIRTLFTGSPSKRREVNPCLGKTVRSPFRHKTHGSAKDGLPWLCCSTERKIHRWARVSQTRTHPRLATPTPAVPHAEGPRALLTSGVHGPSDHLTHTDAQGRASMVDVGGKPVSRRTAAASATVLLGEKAFRLVKENQLAKGDALAVAQIAGIMAAKQTSALIPLCHPIPLDRVAVSLELVEPGWRVVVTATCVASGRTGVEMEALTAASLAALALYDMCKAAARDIIIQDVRLLSKTGGQRGDYHHTVRPH